VRGWRRKATAQARSTAISSVCTQYPAIQAMARRFASTGRKSSSRPACARGGGGVSGMMNSAMAKAPAASTPPIRKAKDGPPSAAQAPASAKETAPAMPTPAACQPTARDCAGPLSGSAIAFRPGM
jgi:hypothetical protein